MAMKTLGGAFEGSGLHKLSPPLMILGWREWVALPELGISAIKAKIDTGARSSALHAFDLEPFERDGKQMVRFAIHPQQRDTQETQIVEAELFAEREVRNSGGHVERRPVIVTPVQIRQETWSIELTLTNRDVMGFRMLLGRQAVRQRFVIDPGRSYVQSPTKTHRFRKSS
jgi:hypothetical protein